MILLNTDWHSANLRPKRRMSKKQYLKNTLDTLQQDNGAGGSQLESDLESIYASITANPILQPTPSVTVVSDIAKSTTALSENAKPKASIESVRSIMPKTQLIAGGQEAGGSVSAGIAYSKTRAREWYSEGTATSMARILCD
jgi:Sec7-like guanine-nucleotide exchange factor